MAIIGTFIRSGADLTGRIETLALSVPVKIRSTDSENDKAPDYRLYAGKAEFEIGAAWKKTSKDGRDYLSVKLDDPSFPSPVYASLLEGEDADKFQLLWTR